MSEQSNPNNSNQDKLDSRDRQVPANKIPPAKPEHTTYLFFDGFYPMIDGKEVDNRRGSKE